MEFLLELYIDFIFVVLSEEYGMIGVLILFGIYFFIIVCGLMLGVKLDNLFGCIFLGGMVLFFFVYVFVNIGMVSGILFVVGVFLLLFSYGGMFYVMLMVVFGLMMLSYVYCKKLYSDNFYNKLK